MSLLLGHGDGTGFSRWTSGCGRHLFLLTLGWLCLRLCAGIAAAGLRLAGYASKNTLASKAMTDMQRGLKQQVNYWSNQGVSQDTSDAS